MLESLLIVKMLEVSLKEVNAAPEGLAFPSPPDDKLSFEDLTYNC